MIYWLIFNWYLDWFSRCLSLVYRLSWIWKLYRNWYLQYNNWLFYDWFCYVVNLNKNMLKSFHLTSPKKAKNILYILKLSLCRICTLPSRTYSLQNGAFPFHLWIKICLLFSLWVTTEKKRQIFKAYAIYPITYVHIWSWCGVKLCLRILPMHV